MAINFLIAVATALGSTSLILLILRFALKAFRPEAFKERIPISERRVLKHVLVEGRIPSVTIHEQQSSAVTVHQQMSDAVMLSYLSQPKVDLMRVSSVSAQPFTTLLSYEREPLTVSTPAKKVSDQEANKRRVEDEEPSKPVSMTDVLNPLGQGIFRSGTPRRVRKQSDSGVPNESFCGTAG